MNQPRPLSFGGASGSLSSDLRNSTRGGFPRVSGSKRYYRMLLSRQGWTRLLLFSIVSLVGRPTWAQIGVVAGPTDITSPFAIKFHVAYDNVNQVYLAVWDGGPAKG